MQANISADLGSAESILQGWLKYEMKLEEFVKNVVCEVSLQSEWPRYGLPNRERTAPAIGLTATTMADDITLVDGTKVQNPYGITDFCEENQS